MVPGGMFLGFDVLPRFCRTCRNLPRICRNLPELAAISGFCGKFAASLFFDEVQKVVAGVGGCLNRGSRFKPGTSFWDFWDFWDWVLVRGGVAAVLRVGCLVGYCLNRGFVGLRDLWDLVLVCRGD